jgi:hypothetical protein
MVHNATFNNISVISLRSVLLVVETGVLGENISDENDKTCVINTDFVFTNLYLNQ